MANPLDAFKNLKPWQQGAVAAGGIGAVGFVWWYREKQKKAASATPVTPATATTAATSGTAGEIEDPTTGLYYPDDSVDPDTGLTYQQEITEYGSVSAADAAASTTDDQAALQGEDPEEYEEEIGETPASAGSTVTTNAQWMAEVETGLSEQGYSASDIGQALAAYFSSTPLGTSSDGTSLFTIMNLAVSEYGPPPTGSYPLLLGSTTSTSTGTSTGSTSTGTTSTGTSTGTTSTGTGSTSTGTTSTGTSTGTTSTGTSTGTSTSSSTTPQAPQTSPPNMAAKVSGASVVLTWGTVGGATGYQIQVAEPGGALVLNKNLTATSATIDVLPVKGQYDWKLRALNQNTPGPWSQVKSFTVTA